MPLNTNWEVRTSILCQPPKRGGSPKVRSLQAPPPPQPFPPSESPHVPFASAWSWLVKSVDECKFAKEFEMCLGQSSLEHFLPPPITVPNMGSHLRKTQEDMENSGDGFIPKPKILY